MYAGVRYDSSTSVRSRYAHFLLCPLNWLRINSCTLIFPCSSGTAHCVNVNVEGMVRLYVQQMNKYGAPHLRVLFYRLYNHILPCIDVRVGMSSMLLHSYIDGIEIDG